MTENVTGPSFEQVKALTNVEIVSGFLCNEVPGRLVMDRVLDRVGMTGIADKPLIKNNQPAVDETGRQLSIGDYLAVAHPSAVEGILGFMLVEETEAEYPAFAENMQSTIAHYAGIEPPKPTVG